MPWGTVPSRSCCALRPDGSTNDSRYACFAAAAYVVFKTHLQTLRLRRVFIAAVPCAVDGNSRRTSTASYTLGDLPFQQSITKVDAEHTSRTSFTHSTLTLLVRQGTIGRYAFVSQSIVDYYQHSRRRFLDQLLADFGKDFSFNNLKILTTVIHKATFAYRQTSIRSAFSLFVSMTDLNGVSQSPVRWLTQEIVCSTISNAMFGKYSKCWTLVNANNKIVWEVDRYRTLGEGEGQNEQFHVNGYRRVVGVRTKNLSLDCMSIGAVRRKLEDLSGFYLMPKTENRTSHNN